MKHIRIRIIATEQSQEELIALLNDYNPTGFEQTDDQLTAYFAEEDFAVPEILLLLEGFQYQQDEIAEQNWNEVWEQNFHPVIVGGFCAVRAHFHEPVPDVTHEIIITPKMSFGTGHHATTYMMMQQMQAIDFTDKTVFDFGTGTGILAILAEKRGAGKIVAIDVDDWSIDNAIENFERNGCNCIDVTLSSELPEDQFDVVLANINRNVILAYMEPLVKICNPGAVILFSGLLVADEYDIRVVAENNGLKLLQQQEKQGWISLLFFNQA